LSAADELDGEPRTVVGVLLDDLGIRIADEGMVPIPRTAACREFPSMFEAIARSPGATIAQAMADGIMRAGGTRA
jgi:hypothetical protein